MLKKDAKKVVIGVIDYNPVSNCIQNRIQNEDVCLKCGECGRIFNGGILVKDKVKLHLL